MEQPLLRPVGMRIARPSRDLVAATAFYVEALGLERIGGFEEHAGYDGVFLGVPGGSWHLELTRQRSGSPVPTPTAEDLLVLYAPADEVAASAARLEAFGFSAVAHDNPFWTGVGAVIVPDPDGYLLVLCPVAD